MFWFGLMLNVPVNNFSVMLGHGFLGITSTFFFFFGGGINMSCSRTKHGDPSGTRTPTSGSEVGGVNHQATAPPFQKCVVSRAERYQSMIERETIHVSKPNKLSKDSPFKNSLKQYVEHHKIQIMDSLG